MKILLTLCAVFSLFLSGCATESSHVVNTEKVQSWNTPYSGPKVLVSVGKFDNKSTYMNGIFSNGENRLGSQAKTLLISALQQTGRFSVLDRENMSEIKQEAAFGREKQNIKGARYVITGDVTAFGRKNVGDRQLFGILGRGKKQIAYSKVDLNVVSVDTSQVVFSAQGAGEYALSNREVIGFGGTSGYDATLNSKVLDLAVREAVNHLQEGLSNGSWQPAE
jgi:curli biogenesis system outer membrane secretion channel CsgG